MARQLRVAVVYRGRVFLPGDEAHLPEAAHEYIQRTGGFTESASTRSDSQVTTVTGSEAKSVEEDSTEHDVPEPDTETDSYEIDELDQAAMNDLMEIRGIGPEVALVLVRKNVRSKNDLKAIPRSVLLRIPGIGEKMADRIEAQLNEISDDQS